MDAVTQWAEEQVKHWRKVAQETQAQRLARRVAELRASGASSTLGQGLGPSESKRAS